MGWPMELWPIVVGPAILVLGLFLRRSGSSRSVVGINNGISVGRDVIIGSPIPHPSPDARPPDARSPAAESWLSWVGSVASIVGLVLTVLIPLIQGWQ